MKVNNIPKRPKGQIYKFNNHKPSNKVYNFVMKLSNKKDVYVTTDNWTVWDGYVMTGRVAKTFTKFENKVNAITNALEKKGNEEKLAKAEKKHPILFVIGGAKDTFIAQRLKSKGKEGFSVDIKEHPDYPKNIVQKIINQIKK